MKPSICFTSFRAYRLFNPSCTVSHGGAELESFLLATQFAKRQHVVSFVTGNFGQPKKEIIEGVTLWRGTRSHRFSALWGVIHTLHLFFIWKKIDANVYFTKGAGWLPFQLVLFSKIFKKKVILKTSHKKNIDLSLQSKAYHPFYRWALTHATAVVFHN